MAGKEKRLRNLLNLYLRYPIIAGIVFAVMNIMVYFISVRAGIVVSIAVLAYFVWLLFMILNKHVAVSKALMDFASGYAQMQKKLLDEFKVPYGLLDNQGKILWLNNSLGAIVGKDNYRKNISTVIPELSKIQIEPGKNLQECNVAIGNRIYKVFTEKIDMSDSPVDVNILIAGASSDLYAIYFIDETEITACRKELHDERFVAALIYIDNYDEALESIDEVRRSLLIALVDRKINKYITAGEGIVRKLEKDKYFVVMRYKFLEKLKEERFAILEEVKSVNIGNDMAVTLSIGIGAMNGSFLKNYEMARAAIDLALGRGGDQTVVRDGNKVTYYGGKSNSLEKNTRVRARVKAHALRELLEGTDNVIIMGHKISDVDAVGAAVGIYTAARIFSKKAHIVLNDITTSLQPIIDLYKNNQEYSPDLFLKSEEALAKVGSNTLLVVVDVNRANYTECPELIGKCRQTVVIDHHRQADDQIENATLSYVEPYASSACEMVAEILQYICDNIRIKSIEADTLYAGIVIDTNNFTNKAGARTFEAAAFLRRNGADIVRVRKLLRGDMNEYKAKAETVRHAEVYKHYALSVCPSSGLQSPTIVGAQAANELLNITGIKASIVFTYYNDTIYLSARSIDEVNVQLIMERLGGGGHMTIAGAQLKDMSLEDAITLVKKTIDTMEMEGAI